MDHRAFSKEAHKAPCSLPVVLDMGLCNIPCTSASCTRRYSEVSAIAVN